VAVVMLAATIGAKALYLLIAWLGSSALGAYLSERKGNGDKPGLASGLLLSVVGAVIWLIVPARENSDWKIKGPWGDERKDARGDAGAAQ
jgi:hypothetical protein